MYHENGQESCAVDVFTIGMKLRVHALREAIASGARGALPLVGGAS